MRRALIPPQWKDWACGAAVVRGVLRCFNIRFDGEGRSINEVRIIPRCGTTEERGTSHQGIVRGLRSFRFSVETGAWQDPDWCFEKFWRCIRGEKIPVIVNCFPAGDGHYALIVGIWERGGQRRIKLADPRSWRLDQRTHVMRWEDFVRAWFDYKEPDHPRAPGSFIARWWAIARLKPLQD